MTNKFDEMINKFSFCGLLSSKYSHSFLPHVIYSYGGGHFDTILIFRGAKLSNLHPGTPLGLGVSQLKGLHQHVRNHFRYTLKT